MTQPTEETLQWRVTELEDGKKYITNGMLSINVDQLPEIIDGLRVIASLGGNLPDKAWMTATGPNDARMRGTLLVEARNIAKKLIADTDATLNEAKEDSRD